MKINRDEVNEVKYIGYVLQKNVGLEEDEEVDIR